ncbi:MAG: helix-turn-helix transcriptional regulator [Patescibacteria group bacterium]
MAIKVDERAVKKQFGAKLRQLRQDRKLSQEGVALEAGLDLTTINEIEMGSRNPSLLTIAKISKALGVKIKDVFSF